MFRGVQTVTSSRMFFGRLGWSASKSEDRLRWHGLRYSGVVDEVGAYRKRMRRREVPGGNRFVTISCQHRLPLFNNPRIAQLFVDALRRARLKHGLLVFAWVVMPEHCHVLCQPPAGTTLESILVRVNMSVTKRVLRRWRELNAPILKRVEDATGRPRFWLKGGGFDRNVRDVTEFCKEVRYIHRNPVERGLVSRPEDWKRSSVRWWMGLREGEFECDPPPGRPGSWDGWMGYV